MPRYKGKEMEQESVRCKMIGQESATKYTILMQNGDIGVNKLLKAHTCLSISPGAARTVETNSVATASESFIVKVLGNG